MAAAAADWLRWLSNLAGDAKSGENWPEPMVDYLDYTFYKVAA
jgi:hypothetical protein